MRLDGGHSFNCNNDTAGDNMSAFEEYKNAFALEATPTRSGFRRERCPASAR